MRKERIVVTLLMMIALLACTVLAADIATNAIDVQSSGPSSQAATFVNQDPDPAEPGGYVDVRFKLENVGTDAAKNVIVELQPEFPFSLDPGDSAQRKLGTIDARQTGENAYIILYRLRIDASAVQGDNQIRVRYTPDNGATWQTLGPFLIRIVNRNPVLAVSSVTSDPEMVAPGEPVKVDVQLKNMAQSFFRNVKVSLTLVKISQTATSVTYDELPFSPVGSTNEKTILRIDPGGVATAEFNLVTDPNTKAGVYKVPMTISYVDELGSNYTHSSIFSLLVGEQPDVVVSVDSSSVYNPGSKGRVGVKFVNKGKMDLKFVSITLQPGSDYDLLSSDNVYLGNIDSDDYSTAEYDLFVKSSAGNVVTLPVLAEYRDANNKKYSESYSLQLRTYSEADAEKFGLIKGQSAVGIIVTVLIVLAGLGAYAYMRKRHKKK